VADPWRNGNFVPILLQKWAKAVPLPVGGSHFDAATLC
jgi:hypothetical protein